MFNSGPELSRAVPTLTTEELIGHVTPLIEKYTRWKVPGFDRDDLRQEIHLVIWRLHGKYRPERGGFIPLAKRSIINRLGQLRQAGLKQTAPVSYLECRGCGHHNERIKSRGGACTQCDNTTWEAIRSPYLLQSINLDNDTDEDTPRARNPGDVPDESVDVEGAALDLLKFRR